jgi:hypothetical protein
VGWTRTQWEASAAAARREAWEVAQRAMATREATRAAERAAAAERTAAAWLQEAKERIAGGRIGRAARRFLDHRGAASRAKAALQAAAASGTAVEYAAAADAARSFNLPGSVVHSAAAAFQRRLEDCAAAVARAEGERPPSSHQSAKRKSSAVVPQFLLNSSSIPPQFLLNSSSIRPRQV